MTENVGRMREFAFVTMKTIPSSVGTSDVLTSDPKFQDNFLMSDVLATNLMLTGLLFLFTTLHLI